jgi:hypothetical protein
MRFLSRTVLLRSLALGLVAIALVFASAVVRAAIDPLTAASKLTPTVAQVESKQIQPELPDPYEGKPAPLPDAVPMPSYTPRMESAPAHPTNFGQRFSTDIYGNPVNNRLLVVIHETVGSASSAINTFQTPHYREEDQARWHRRSHCAARNESVWSRKFSLCR